MKLHSLAKLFPPMSVYAFELLKDDIKMNGCHTPLWLYEDMIIDGRHRFEACEELDIKPEYKIFEGTEKEMLAFVISQNLHRRHLSESQRAMIAANIANLPIGKSKTKDATESTTQPTAAKMLNVGMRSVSRATVIKKNGSPLLGDKVENGEITVSGAETIAKLPHDEQDKAINSGARTAAELTKIAFVSKPEPVKDKQYELSTISNVAGGVLTSETYPNKESLLKAVNTAINEDTWDTISVVYR